MFLPTGFDKSIALEAAGLVNQAYDQFDHFTQKIPWSLQGNYKTLTVLSAKPEGLLTHLEPFGFVASSLASANVFVTFRGTKTIEDWLADLTFPQVAHPWGHTEEGFSHLYQQCSADVLTAVKSAAAPNVFVTGHSLGAALATLATADLVNSGVTPQAGMYTLAGPRAGDLAFAAEFNRRVAVGWRIVNTEDIVTTVPLATPELFASQAPHSPLGMVLMLAGHLNYEHVGTPVSFTTHKGTIPANHAMQVYIDALKVS